MHNSVSVSIEWLRQLKRDLESAQARTPGSPVAIRARWEDACRMLRQAEQSLSMSQGRYVCDACEGSGRERQGGFGCEMIVECQACLGTGWTSL